MNKKIVIFNPEADVGLNHSLINTINLLADAGYMVDLFTIFNPNFVVMPAFDSKLVKVIKTHASINSHKLISIPWYYLTLIIFNNFFNPYVCLIGVSFQGLFQAGLVSRFIKTPIIYYSMELLFLDELDRSKKPHRNWMDIKRREIDISRNCEFIIIQDSERAKILSEINDIPLSKFLTVPNSPLELARINKSYHWHKLFGLTNKQRIVLHTGDIKKYTAICKIIDSVKDWPSDWVLVVHTYNDNKKLLENLKNRSASGRVFFSTILLENETYTEMIDSADIGIAFYETINGKTFVQKNIINIGLSSGKIAYYLRSGLPIIINKVTTFNKIVDTEKCGICVDTADDIKQAISIIDENYAQYSQRACQTYNNYFDFRANFEKVLQRLQNI